MEKKEKPLLTEKQETILKELAKNPNIKKTELGNLVGYKSKNSIWTTLRAIKKKCEKNEEVKKRVLELYPDFLKPREEQKTQQTMEKKVKPLLTEKQETILKELAKNPNIKKPALGKLAGFKNSYSIYRALKELKKKYEEDKKTKEAILKLYPDFLKPKEKKEKSCSPPLQNKKRNRKKRKGGELPPSQQKLLEILKKRNTISITDPETIKKLGYSSPKTIYNTISNIRIKCQKNADFKKQVLKIYPEFLTPQKKLSLSEKELQILQSLYLVTPPQTAYLSQTQVAKKFKCSQPIIFKEKEKALRKIAQSEEIKTKLEEIWPTFDQDRIIKEQYKISRSVKMPREDVEGIKDLISQFNSQENKTEKPKSPILTGIKNLEESIFSPYVSQCTEEQKAMLALRLGFINAPSTTETVAKLFNVEQQEVITLTKNCLQSVKSLLEEKPPQKKKGELRKS